MSSLCASFAVATPIVSARRVAGRRQSARAPVRVQAKPDDKDVHSSSLKSTNLSPPALYYRTTKIGQPKSCLLLWRMSNNV